MRATAKWIFKVFFFVMALATSSSPLMAYPLVAPECRGKVVECAVKGELDFISIFGPIGSEDLAFFELLDAELPDDMPLPTVFLNSPGGLVSSAIGIGRILRKRHAAVESGSPVVEDYHPECSSACVLIAAGAETRRLTHIGLHGASRRIKTGVNTAEDVGAPSSKVYAFFDEMGIPFQVSEIIKATPFTDMADYFYNPRLTNDEQEIVQFGFFMPQAKPFDPAQIFPEPYIVPFTDQSLIELAYEAGSLTAAYDLASLYLRYDPDVPPDFVAANQWLEKGILRGDLRAMHDLGYHYSYGIGLEIDLTKAMPLYRAAAEAGYAPSQNNLGWAYYTGDGVPKSLPNAIYWITKAAEQGEPFAYGSLCEISDATDLFKNNPTEAC